MRMIFSLVPGATRERESEPQAREGEPQARARASAPCEGARGSCGKSPQAGSRRGGGGRVVAVADPQYNSTIYLRRQPPGGFHHNDELHAYLRTRFPEVGLSRGRARPLYEVADAELYRAMPGEVLTHCMHGGSRTNPHSARLCPSPSLLPSP